MSRRTPGKHAAPTSRRSPLSEPTPRPGRHRAERTSPLATWSLAGTAAGVATVATVASFVAVGGTSSAAGNGTSMVSAETPLTASLSTAQLATTTASLIGTSASGLSGQESVTLQRPVSLTPLTRAQRLSRATSRQALAASAKAKVKEPGSAQAKEQNASLVKLAESAEKAAADLAKNAWQLPIAAGAYTLTARFGSCSSLWSHCHTGLDFAAPTGTPVVGVASGTITEVGYAGAYGNRIVQTLDDGTELWYCHLNAFNTSVGQPVVGGQVIGYVGSTGNSTGPHLHLEVRPGGGDAVDPFSALSANGQQP